MDTMCFWVWERTAWQQTRALSQLPSRAVSLASLAFSMISIQRPYFVFLPKAYGSRSLGRRPRALGRRSRGPQAEGLGAQGGKGGDGGSIYLRIKSTKHFSTPFSFRVIYFEPLHRLLPFFHQNYQLNVPFLVAQVSICAVPRPFSASLYTKWIRLSDLVQA